MNTIQMFYDKYAEDFSKSRFRIWKQIQIFLDGLSAHSSVIDIGCGNGKNMLYRRDLNIVGLEYSQELCRICHLSNLNVIQGDARRLPFSDSSMDAAIMIAVIHHLEPDEHHIVLNEINRVLRQNGICLISNWAVEQPSYSKRTFHSGLNIVKWKNKEDEPLKYWVMDEKDAMQFVDKLPSTLKCITKQLDEGNWYFLLQKS